MRCAFLIAVVFFITGSCSGQNVFTATVKDSLTKELLAGATVVEKGTVNGIATGADGIAQLKTNAAGPVTFIVSFIGYQSKEITVILPQKVSPAIILLAPSASEIEEVTVTSVRTNSRIEDIPTKVEVIGMEDLKEENGVKPGNIVSILGDIAGIQLQQVSATSGNTYARIQGLNGRYTQLLKDGMPLYGGLSGGFGIMQIPPLDLKQIEIIKGSASTLYSGDAIGGIINLISKDPGDEPELTFTVNQSTLLETDINGYYSQRYKKTGVTLFAGHTYQKEMDIDNDGLSDIAQVNSTVIHPKIVFYFNPRSTFTLNYTGTWDDRKGGDMRYFESSPSDTLYHVTNNINRHNADARWVYEFSKSKNLSVKLSSSYLFQKMRTKFYPFDASQLIYFSEISYFTSGIKADWVAGVNFNGDIFDNTSSILSQPFDYNFNTFGGFIQNTWRIAEKFTIESGFRGDYHSHYGFFPLPRLALMYKFLPEFTVRLNGGLGYKIPNLVTYIDPETDLNKITLTHELKTELSQGVNADINFHKLFKNELGMTINQSFFFTNISKPIYDSSSTFNVVAPVNAEKGLRTIGAHTYVRLEYKKFELYLAYVFTDVSKLYDTLHYSVPVTPALNFATAFFYQTGKHWRTGIESSYVAGQVDENYKSVDNYLLFAAMVQFNYGKFSFVLNGENLLDYRQNKNALIYDGTISDPQFHELWAPIDGRVINLSVKYSVL